MGYLRGEFSSDLKNIDSYPTLSPAAVEILSIVDRKETTVKDIVNLISIDKVLYANIFKYVNSAVFCLRKSPKNLEEALKHLGLYGVRDLIFVLAAKNLFNSPHNWERSVFIAFLSKKLALRLGLAEKQASDIYIAALVHDIGSMALETKSSQEYELVQEESDLYLRFSMEKGLFGVNSIELSCEILEASGIPDSILKIISRQALAHDHDSYSIENTLIDLANDLSMIDYNDQRDLDETLEQEKFKNTELSEIEISLKYLRKLNKEARNFINY